MKKLAIVVALLGFGLAGCGGSSSNVAPSNSPRNNGSDDPSSVPVQHVPRNGARVDWLRLNDSYYISYWRMPSGKILTCVEDDYDSGSLSCNWEAYNALAGG